MPAFISKKQSLILFLCSLGMAAGIIFLLHYVLAGPRLSPVYDTLMDFRSPPLVSGEILLIETDEVLEPSDMFTVLMTLTEMGASDLIVEVPILGNGFNIDENGEDLSERINDEFALLGSNIRNLFEAIRLGLIPPIESPVYVGNLVALTEMGRDRLHTAIARQDEAGTVITARASAVFGKVIMAQDLRAVPRGDISWYSRPRPDSDGILRRIAPEAETEHIVYHVLKPRIAELPPLDRDGNILVEKQAQDSLRRLTLNAFRDYDQTGRLLVRLLKEAVSLGVYAEILPERIPHILFDYAETLKEELLTFSLENAESEESEDFSKRAEWINARADYFAALDDFLLGPSEMILVNGYEELIAEENDIGEAGLARLKELRDELIRSFAAMREAYSELVPLRNLLAQSLDTALCIIGPAAPLTESSALLANALLTGHGITPSEKKYILLWPAIAAFIVLVCIHALSPALVLILGCALSLVCGAAFGVSFVMSGYWIDPFIPVAACLGGTLFLALSRFCIGYGSKLRFRLAYSGAVNNDILKRLLKTGRPPLSQTLCSQAVIIAVKNPGMSGREDRTTPLEAASAAAKFRKEFSALFKQHGALVLGFENDIAMACFGSPPQRVYAKETLHPVNKAIPCVKEIAANPVAAEWRFGIEAGVCAFSWSQAATYTANGHPVSRARIFASLALRYKVRAIAGVAALEAGELPMKKIATLAGENFYELPV